MAPTTLPSTVNKDIPAQNGGNPTAMTKAINNQVSARQRFDTKVAAITFPTSAQADARNVITTDAALESTLGTLAVNTADTSNYNAVFATVTPADNAFTAADTALSSDLGLVSTP